MSELEQYTVTEEPEREASRGAKRKKNKKEKEKKPLWKEILSWIFTILGAVAAALVIRSLIVEPVKVDGEYYMPLVINWMGTQPNPVTDQLITAWQNNKNAGEKIGAYITYTSGDMTSALYGEYCQMPAYGFTRARYGVVNFATGFTSAVYDQSFSWTIDPDLYVNYSGNYLMDEADFYV